MPRKTNIYKLDRRDIEEKLVLATVLGDVEMATTIEHFCTEFSIPLDEDRVASRMTDLNTLKAAIEENAVTKAKKTPAK